MITLTSDFGLKDPYVAEMKGVILTLNPKATIIDITHQVEKFNICMGAFMLASAAPYFPEGTIHLAIVDPGVGTQRRPLLIQTKKSLFLGPDNGILILAAKAQGIEHAYQLTNPHLMLPKVSSTFHGRDIFAPAAANLEKGIPPAEFGPEIKALVTPEFAKVKRVAGFFIGEILQIDGFGNIITNIREGEILGKSVTAINLELANASLKLSFAKTYAQAKPKEFIAVIGSHGFLEIALNQASAAEKLNAKAGDRIKVMVS